MFIRINFKKKMEKMKKKPSEKEGWVTLYMKILYYFGVFVHQIASNAEWDHAVLVPWATGAAFQSGLI